MATVFLVVPLQCQERLSKFHFTEQRKSLLDWDSAATKPMSIIAAMQDWNSDIGRSGWRGLATGCFLKETGMSWGRACDVS